MSALIWSLLEKTGSLPADMAEAQTSEHIQSHPIIDDWIEAEEAAIPASDSQLADDRTTYKTDPDSGPIGSTGGHSVA